MAVPQDLEDNSAAASHAFASRQAMSVLDLSMDVLVHILSLLQPADVVSASQRWLWMTVLRKVCNQQMIFKPTFHKMESMSLQELKQAAITPTRLLSHLKQCSLSRNTPRIDFSVGGENSFMLAPGGRYLLVCTPNMLLLWDLGHGANSSFTCCCSTTLVRRPRSALDVYRCQIIDLRMTTNTLGLRVMFEIEFLEPDVEIVYWVYEVFPMDIAPDFCSIESASIEKFEEVHIRCSGNEVVIAGTSEFGMTSFIVWNFAVDAWTKWDLEGVDMLQHPVIDLASVGQLHVCHGCVIAINDSTIAVYAIPELSPRVAGERPPTVVHKPQATYKLKCAGGCYDSFIVTHPWYDATATGDISNYLDILCENITGDTALEHCVLRRMDIQADKSPLLEVLHTHEILSPDSNIDLGCVQSTWATHRDLICVSRGDKQIVTKIFTLPASEPEHESLPLSTSAHLAGECVYRLGSSPESILAKYGSLTCYFHDFLSRYNHRIAVDGLNGSALRSSSDRAYWEMLRPFLGIFDYTPWGSWSLW
ncbi:hypothetical protein FIBSPDRAFT_974341 [Athelia psychrophila]|uniref:F-box domain-containing protein n=1 Tax=Athelia psychrophila TaxID=1759441 RepID=A0A166FKT2_9AGAM|nr:hypothetical protein FIBSPDRAFT_974341 [Fibularhizoctonia sp. CBS 109695]